VELLKKLLDNNLAWATKIKETEPDFFETLAKHQAPEYLWIGCADSRVPSSQLTGLMPGDIFVHRNIANLVIHTDLNCLSVIQYAVEVLKVKHIIVCGHYGCGGVKAAMEKQQLGLIDNWLRHIQDTEEKYKDVFSSIADENQRFDKLCELNVFEQVVNVCQTTMAQDAWARKQELAVHGFVYRLSDGLLHEMNVSVENHEELLSIHNRGAELVF